MIFAMSIGQEDRGRRPRACMRVPSVARSAGPWSARSSKTRPNASSLNWEAWIVSPPEERQR